MGINRRQAIKITAGSFIATSESIPFSANAFVDPITMSALIGALTTLFIHFSNKSEQTAALAQQLKQSTEAPRGISYQDFHMQNSDPNVIIQVSNSNGILLNYQAPVASKVFLTIQDGIPYLQYDGLGNTDESNINRWEANVYGEKSNNDNGETPVPASIRYSLAKDNSLLSQARNSLERNGVDSREWAPQYIRNNLVNGSKAKKLLVAQNVNTRNKKAFWV